MIDLAQIRHLMIDPAQIRRNVNAMDSGTEPLIYMLEMHELAMRSTKQIKSPKDFYVYVLLDPRKPGNIKYGEYLFEFEPFYVGLGKGNRWKSHFQCKEGITNKNVLVWEIVLSGSPYSVRFVYESKCATAVKEKEAEIIRTIGIASRNEGPLLNAKE